VRSFGRTGNPLWKTSLRDGARWLDAGGASAYGLGVLVTGTATNRDAWDLLGGQVWRIAS
jgi:hypothetical protein